jgi:uncharacterized coiled-coil protein SlyX
LNVDLTVADIDLWSADAVRAVSHAADRRGRICLDAAGAMALDETWVGAKAEARQYTNAAIRDDLTAHGIEVQQVARAAREAADHIAHLQARLAALRLDAAELDISIDSLTNTVHPASDITEQLQRQLNIIVAEANSTDRELAGAIVAADDPPPDHRPQIRRALSEPLPDDPRQFNELWSRLNPDQKDWLFRRDDSIGNRAGMPWDPPDRLGKDHYNRLHLDELERRSRSDVDQLGRSIAELLQGHHTDDGILDALQTQLASARTHLEGYRAVRTVLGSEPNRYLGLLDEFGHGAVSIGNPDTAGRNAIFLPGTGQDLSQLNSSDEFASAMWAGALAVAPGLTPRDVAVTTWMGYDRPMDLARAALPGPAQHGAGQLDAFEDGLRASHVGPRSIDTVVGHSYGSTLLGAAASGGHHLDVDNVIAVGSPGMLVERADQLSLGPAAHVYAMRAGNDIIGFSGMVTEWTLGAEPTAPGFGATRLAADPGPNGLFGLPSVGAHSNYWSDGNRALTNFGAVIAGLPAPYVMRP